MAEVPTPDALRALIIDAYGSLATPHFARVSAPYAGHPYDRVRLALGRVFTVEDDTDLNENVSQVLILSGRSSSWVLYLSFLGPYAAVTRVGEGNTSTVVESAGDDAESPTLFAALSDHGVAVLPRRVLEVPIEIVLPYTEPGNARLFQALFADYDVLPWKMRAG